jgi:hypothetical protein
MENGKKRRGSKQKITRKNNKEGVEEVFLHQEISASGIQNTSWNVYYIIPFLDI